MTTDLTPIEAGVWTITPGTPVEQIADVRGKLEWLIRRAKEVMDMLDEKMVEKIQATGEDIVIGEVRYYVGNPKKVKCRDHEKTLLEVFTVAAGDFYAVSQCLASSAWKYGAVRVLLEDNGKAALFDELFETTSEPTLVEGKPVKRLMKHSPQFAGG